jgi:pimeloyl-ACP methyl ester carboxylesterase
MTINNRAAFALLAILSGSLFGGIVPARSHDPTSSEPVKDGGLSGPVDAAERWVVLPDGRRIKIKCAGSGSPAVILQGGLGWLERPSWSKVQPEVSRFARVCAYDPAGTGDSDPGPLPRDGAHLVTDLHTLLLAAGEKPPYVLVGHSRGGLLIRIYTAHFPGEIAGLVFVDPSVPGQFDLLGGRDTLADGKAYFSKCLAGAKSGQMQPGGALFAECHIYPESWPAVLGLAQRPATWETNLSVYESFDADCAEIAATEHPPYTMPLIVLTASERNPGLTKALSEGSQREWLNASQKRLASLSTRGEQRLVDQSSHYIQIDQPAAVVKAIKDVIGERPRR